MSDDPFADPRLAPAGALLAAARTLDAVVAALRATARRVVGADGIAVVLREGDACHYVAEDAIEPLWRGRRFPLSACVSGWAMLHAETAVVPDIDRDPRVPAEAYRITSMRSLVMVPIGSPEPSAALGAYWCSAVMPDAATVCLMEALARRAGAAIARASDGLAVPAR